MIDTLFKIFAFGLIGIIILGLFIGIIFATMVGFEAIELDKKCKEKGFEYSEQVDGFYNCCKTNIDIEDGKYVEETFCVIGD